MLVTSRVPVRSSTFVSLLKSILPSVRTSPSAPAKRIPCCVRSLIFAVSATKASMFAVPSIYKS